MHWNHLPNAWRVKAACTIVPYNQTRYTISVKSALAGIFARLLRWEKAWMGWRRGDGADFSMVPV